MQEQHGDGDSGNSREEEGASLEVREMTQEEATSVTSAVSAALLQLLTVPPVAGAAELRPGLSVEVVNRTPLMFYREGRLSEPQPFLCVRFPATVPVKKASEALRRVASQGCLLLGHRPLRWDDTTVYEDDVKLRAHFFHDCRLSAGSWIRIDPAGAISQASRNEQHPLPWWRRFPSPRMMTATCCEIPVFEAPMTHVSPVMPVFLATGRLSLAYSSRLTIKLSREKFCPSLTVSWPLIMKSCPPLTVFFVFCVRGFVFRTSGSEPSPPRTGLGRRRDLLPLAKHPVLDLRRRYTGNLPTFCRRSSIRRCCCF